MDKIKLYRVSYGNKDTPEELREYRINDVGPVGTISEIKEHFNITDSDIEIMRK